MKRPFDRTLYRTTFEKMLSLSGEALEKKLDEMEYQERNLKIGENVISLYYYQRVLPDQDVEDLRNELGKANIELSYFDKTNSIQASVLDYLFHLYITTNILDEVLKNVVWDVLIVVFGKAFQLAKEKSLGRKDVALGITFDIETGDKNKFRKLKIDISPELDTEVVIVALKTLQKIVPFVVSESKDKKQKSRFIKETLSLANDGKWTINRFESPEYEEKKQKKKKKKK